MGTQLPVPVFGAARERASTARLPGPESSYFFAHRGGRQRSFHKAADMGRRMGKTDIERIRLEAVQRVIRGESPEKVIVEYGFARSCIYDWLKRHREGGDDALRSRRSPGRPPSLSNEDYKQLLEALLASPEAPRSDHRRNQSAPRRRLPASDCRFIRHKNVERSGLGIG
jgi:Helix-turn-helix domain